jgi:hypothetical protein
MIEPISDELIENVLAVLKINDAKIRSGLKKVIYDVGVTYVCAQQLSQPLASAKSQKAKINQMAHLSRKLLNVTKDIEWEFFNTLDYAVAIVDSDRDSFRSLSRTQSDLDRLAKGCELFLEKYKPSKGARSNLLLQEAVIELVAPIYKATSTPVTISRNKHSTGEPTLKSDGARAIGMLLRGIDPKLTDTMIANMIDKVSNGKLSPDPYEDLLDFMSEPTPTHK